MLTRCPGRHPRSTAPGACGYANASAKAPTTPRQGREAVEIYGETGICGVSLLWSGACQARSSPGATREVITGKDSNPRIGGIRKRRRAFRISARSGSDSQALPPAFAHFPACRLPQVSYGWASKPHAKADRKRLSIWASLMASHSTHEREGCRTIGRRRMVLSERWTRPRSDALIAGNRAGLHELARRRRRWSAKPVRDLAVDADVDVFSNPITGRLRAGPSLPT